jgi:DNA adenine methylase
MSQKPTALRYHGGKFRLAPWIISHFPAHKTYVEPFGGAAGVLLRKERSYAEVYNDLDGDVVNFFAVIRDPQKREALIEAIALTPYARDEFEADYDHTDDPVERARRLCVRSGMGFGSAATTGQPVGFRIDTARPYGTAQAIWTRFPQTLGIMGDRFGAVLIENRAADIVIRNHDRPDTLFFVDPPYLAETRRMGKSACYRHEMTEAQHAALLAQLTEVKGMVVLSGYRSELYDRALAGWTAFEKDTAASGGRGSVARTETVWLNPACAAALQRRAA